MQAYVNKFASNSNDAGRLQFQLKSESFETILRVIGRIANNSSTILRAVGKPFPQSLSELGAYQRSGPRRHDADSEIKWITALSITWAPRINAFLLGQHDFERHILTSNYAAASDTLANIRSSIGESVWLSEATLLLASLQGGLQSLRSTLSALSEAIHHSNLQILHEWLAQKLEPKISSSAFDEQLKTLFAQYAGDPSFDPIMAYFRARLSFFDWDFNDHLPFVLWYECQHSLPDAYLLLVRVLQSMIARGHWSPSPDVRAAVTMLAKAVCDPRIRNIATYLSPQCETSPQPQTEDLLGIVDAYTQGSYATAIHLCDMSRVKYPNCFDLHELHAKAAVNSSTKLTIPEHSPTIADFVNAQLYDALAKGQSTELALSLLTKLSYLLDCTHFGTQLRGFCLRYTKNLPLVNPLRFTIINQSTLTPRFANIYKHPSDSGRFLDTLETLTPDHVSISLLRPGGPEPLSLPPERVLEQHARLHERNGDIDSAITCYATLQSVAEGRVTVLEDAFLGLFSCYCNRLNYTAAAEIAVRAYLSNTHLLSALHLDRLVSAYPGQANEPSLCWPLIYYFYYTDHGVVQNGYKIFTALDDFLTASNALVPSDLLSTNLNATPEFVLFLRLVCTTEILDSSFHFATLDELEQERIKLCQFLMKADPPNSDSYFAEITDLSRRGLIRQGIKHIDESKVFVDVRGIRKSTDRTIPALFERLRELVQITDLNLRRMSVTVISVGQGQARVVLKDMAHALFLQLFDEIRTRFISSNEHGLDSYLSIRIRHGTISGQLRSQFEELNLVTRKGSDSQYKLNDYWDKAIGTEPQSIRDTVQRHLATLSTDVDALIDKVKGSWIQIKQATTPDGMFDYGYSDEQLLLLFRQLSPSPDYDTFFAGCVSELTSRTERNLTAIRDVFNSVLLTDFERCLDRCFSNVVLAAPSLRSDLRSVIVKCKTALQNEIATISDWFRMVQERDMPDFAFIDLINTAIAVVSRASRTVELKAVTQIDVVPAFKGSTFAALFDVAHILLENAVRHSAGPIAEVRLTAALSDDNLILELETPIGDPQAIALVQAKLAQLERRRELSETDPVKTEGGTGFFKLHKLLSHDLGLGSTYSLRWFVGEGGMFCSRTQFRLDGVQV